MNAELARHLLSDDPARALEAIAELERMVDAMGLRLAYPENEGERWGVAHIGDRPAELVHGVLLGFRRWAAMQLEAERAPDRSLGEAVPEIAHRHRRL